MWWFSRLKFCISRLKIRRYDTKGKRKFKRMLSFLSVGKRKLFAMKLSFEEFNLTADRSAWLVLNQPRRQSLTNSRGSRVAGPMSRSRVQSRGRGSNVAVAGPMSRSRVQCRGRGSNVAAGENDLKTTDMKTI